MSNGFDFAITEREIKMFFDFVGYLLIFSLISYIILTICLLKIFKKADKPCWAALVPFYNIYVLVKIAELPFWYFVLTFIPFAQLFAYLKIYVTVARKFGKSTGFGVCMLFFSVLFMPVLAFGKSKYTGSGKLAPIDGNANDLIRPDANLNNGVQNNMPVNNVINVQPRMDFNNPGLINSGGVVSANSVSVFQPVGDVNINRIDDVKPNTVDNTNVNMANNVSNNQTITKQCPRCGKVHPSTVQYCDNCGQQI